MGVQKTTGRAYTSRAGKTRYRGSCNSGHIWHGPIRDTKDQAHEDWKRHVRSKH